MSPKIGSSIHVSIFSSVLSELLYPLIRYVTLPRVTLNDNTLTFLPPTVCVSAVGLFSLASRMKPYGVSQIWSCCNQGEFALTLDCCGLGMAPGAAPQPPKACGSMPARCWAVCRELTAS